MALQKCYWKCTQEVRIKSMESNASLHFVTMNGLLDRIYI